MMFLKKKKHECFFCKVKLTSDNTFTLQYSSADGVHTAKMCGDCSKTFFNDAQYRYYLGVLRSRNRFSKWHKAEKNTDLDAIQEVYSVNRTVAKMYLKTLSKDDLKRVHEKLQKGG